METANAPILFNTEQTEALVRNVQELEVDLNAVDIIVLSHGQYDHSGGLPDFLALSSF